MGQHASRRTTHKTTADVSLQGSRTLSCLRLLWHTSLTLRVVLEKEWMRAKKEHNSCKRVLGANANAFACTRLKLQGWMDHDGSNFVGWCSYEVTYSGCTGSGQVHLRAFQHCCVRTLTRTLSSDAGPDTNLMMLG